MYIEMTFSPEILSEISLMTIFKKIYEKFKYYIPKPGTMLPAVS